MSLSFTFAAVCNEILLPFQHQCQVAHGHTELQDAALMITALQGFMVLQWQHRQHVNTPTKIKPRRVDN